MKAVFFLSLSLLSVTAWSAQDWKVVAETTNCLDKLEVLAKPGEKSVFVVNGEKKIKLQSEDGSTFENDGPSTTTFTNEHDKSAIDKYSFTQPGMVDGNPPKLTVLHAESKDQCRMKRK
jgi:hypothetical protein